MLVSSFAQAARKAGELKNLRQYYSGAKFVQRSAIVLMQGPDEFRWNIQACFSLPTLS